MNYDHHYHAGNFADVMKHLIMMAIINKLQQKDKPLFILDTHAGAGQYHLQDDKAVRTAEADAGIQLFWRKRTQAQHPLLQQYSSLLQSFNTGSANLQIYPGSPRIIHALMTSQTRLVACEKHLQVYDQLRYHSMRMAHTKVLCDDGYVMLKKMLPPVQRRGFVLIDPPYEVNNEFEQITQALQEALKKFATGVYMMWYPIKYQDQIQQFFKDVLVLPTKNIFLAEVLKMNLKEGDQLRGSGVMIINLPFTVDQEIEESLRACLALMSDCQQYQLRTLWLKQPN